jgi:surface antigen
MGVKSKSVRKLKTKHSRYLLYGLILLGLTGIIVYTISNKKTTFVVGQPIDSLNGVRVYYNGRSNMASRRNLTTDNYNLGIKYQCVEFVKRYYYEHLNHKMTNSYGDAKDFFDSKIQDGEINTARNLVQYRNPGSTKPEVDDILVLGGTTHHKYGHVAIISKVKWFRIEVIQQNKGKTRQSYLLIKIRGKWFIINRRILGWLRKE